MKFKSFACCLVPVEQISEVVRLAIEQGFSVRDTEARLIHNFMKNHEAGANPYLAFNGLFGDEGVLTLIPESALETCKEYGLTELDLDSLLFTLKCESYPVTSCGPFVGVANKLYSSMKNTTLK